MSFIDKAKDIAEQHDDKVDQAAEKAGEQVDERTGGRYADQVDKGVDYAQEHTGQGDTGN